MPALQSFPQSPLIDTLSFAAMAEVKGELGAKEFSSLAVAEETF